MSFSNVKEDKNFAADFVKRNHDIVNRGLNNNIIILGTDRAKKGPAKATDGLGSYESESKGKGTSSVHIIAGLKSKDPDLTADKSFIYLSEKTEVDDNLSFSEDKESKVAAGILKSDVIRIVGRKNVKITANDDEKHYILVSGSKVKVVLGSSTFTIEDQKVTINSPKINIIGGAEKVFGDVFDALWSTLDTHVHPSSGSPATPIPTAKLPMINWNAK